MNTRYIKKIDERTPIDIVIPAAGMGKRMKSYGPKALIQIGKNKNIIQKQIAQIKKVLPVNRIILVAGFEAAKLMNEVPSDVICIENERYEETNVIRSLGMGLRATEKDVLVIYGDLVFNDKALEALNLNKSCTIVGNDIMDASEIGCSMNKDEIKHMMYDLDTKWSQITFYRGKELGLLKKHCWSTDNERMFGFEIINKILESGGYIKGIEEKGIQVIDVDNSKDITKVKTIK